MNMLAGKILDFSDDSHGLVLIENEEMLEKVGSIKPMSPEQYSDLADHEYALVIQKEAGGKRRNFPVNDKDNTVLSQEYFDKTAMLMPEQARAKAAFFIKRACDQYEVDCLDSVKSASEQCSGDSNWIHEKEFRGYVPPKVEKQATDVDLSGLEDSDFAIIAKKAGEVHRMYPTANKSLVSASIYHFASADTSEWGPQAKITIARNLEKKADEHGVSEGVSEQLETIRKIASADQSSDMFAHIQTRISMTEDEKQREALSTIWEKRAELADNGIDPAGLIAEFDKQHGFDKHYSRGLATPMDSVYSEKVASDVNDEILSKIADNIDQMEGILNEDTIKSFKGDASEAFGSLTPAAQDMLITAAKQGAFLS
jgi:hypothetical protein